MKDWRKVRDMDMFCFQCEQKAKDEACTRQGVCGKDPEVAALQDALVHVTKGVSMYAHRAAQNGKRDNAVDAFVPEAFFATLTNVDFDPQRFVELVGQATEMRDRARALYEDAVASPESLGGPAAWDPGTDKQTMIERARKIGIDARKEVENEDILSLRETIVYGLKGAAAYTDHARILGVEDSAHYASIHEALDATTRDDLSGEDLTGWALKTGAINLRAMELLDQANTGAYGHPEPTQVRVTPVAGKAIVVSGHDLKDLKMLLEQTEGKGINIYTHGEMLPAHGYPELKKHAHLAGNFGGAWQEQQREFGEFPGAILMTTNCLQKPFESYRDRIYTTGLVGWPEIPHIEADADGNKDFAPVIEAALAAPGFAEDGPEQRITVGFGHNAVMGVADTVIGAVKGGQIRHFFLVGGCDGAKPGRNYYTEFVEQVPDDCVVLTLACGKFRFNKMDLGDIGGIPRLLDVGQCNDAYSAVKIAEALAGAFECGINDLPLSIICSWYEQKAVAILLTLLHLGVKDIRLGPSLPAFTSDNVLQTLVQTFDLKPIDEPQKDLAACLG
jgi:hydroxylamine reductase